MKIPVSTPRRASLLALLVALGPGVALAQAEGSGVVSPNPVVSPTGTNTVQQAVPRSLSGSAAPGARRGRDHFSRRTPPLSTPPIGPDASPSERSDARNRQPMPTAGDPSAGLGTSAPRPPR